MELFSKKSKDTEDLLSNNNQNEDDDNEIINDDTDNELFASFSSCSSKFRLSSISNTNSPVFMNETRNNFSLTNSTSFLANIHSDLLKSQAQHQTQSLKNSNTGDELSLGDKTTENEMPKPKAPDASPNSTFSVPKLNEATSEHKLEELNFEKLSVSDKTIEKEPSNINTAKSATATTTSCSSTTSSTSTTISTSNLTSNESSQKQKSDDTSAVKTLEKTQFSKSIGNLDVPVISFKENKSKQSNFNALHAATTNNSQQTQQQQPNVGYSQNVRHFNHGSQMLSKSMSIKHPKKHRPIETSGNNYKLNRYSSAITTADLIAASNSNFPSQNQMSTQNNSFGYQKRMF